MQEAKNVNIYFFHFSGLRRPLAGTWAVCITVLLVFLHLVWPTTPKVAFTGSDQMIRNIIFKVAEVGLLDVGKLNVPWLSFFHWLGHLTCSAVGPCLLHSLILWKNSQNCISAELWGWSCCSQLAQRTREMIVNHPVRMLNRDSDCFRLPDNNNLFT